MLNKLKLLFANTDKSRIVYFFLFIVIILSASLYLQKKQDGATNAIKGSVYRTKKYVA